MQADLLAHMACRAPSVQKCLNCTRPECNVAVGVPYDASEKEALTVAGMIGRHASPRIESGKSGNHMKGKGKNGKGKSACKTV